MGWMRLDARGNTGDKNAQFILGCEWLAFPVDSSCSEIDYPTIHAAPHPATLHALATHTDATEMMNHLPTEL